MIGQLFVGGHGGSVCVVLLFFLVVSGISADSHTCYNECEWTEWESWGRCSRSCGGGEQRRYRSVCCPGRWNNLQACLTHCSKPLSAASETRKCNEFCCNGAYTNDRCTCPNTHHGTCCEYVYFSTTTTTTAAAAATTTTPTGGTTAQYTTWGARLKVFCPGARAYQQELAATTPSSTGWRMETILAPHLYMLLILITSVSRSL